MTSYNVDELLIRVAAEPPRAVSHAVRIPDPEAVRAAVERGPMRLSELQELPAMAGIRTTRYRHMLGAPVVWEELDDWMRRWPDHPLPDDLRALLLRVNGIHLWADEETGRAYTGLAPLDEWELARTKMYGPDADPMLLSDDYLALSYDQDADAFVVLSVSKARYFLMDAYAPDETSPIGVNVGELLAWVWEHRLAP